MVEVTQADYVEELAQTLCLGKYSHMRGYEGYRDGWIKQAISLIPFIERHRHAAMLEGARLMQEAVCTGLTAYANHHREASKLAAAKKDRKAARDHETMMMAIAFRQTEIAKLDPAQIVFPFERGEHIPAQEPTDAG